jgi:MULE transposase domain
MRFTWPADTPFTQRILTVEQRTCDHCARTLHVCDHRRHRLFTLPGPLELVCKLARCPEPACLGHAHTLSPQAEAQITLPWWTIGWDVFCWLGHRRFAQHWSIPQLRAELRATYRIPLSEDALAGYLRRYQIMVAARHQDAAQLAAAYQQLDALVLTIDGLQPEKGHETLYVVRELQGKRVWFAEPLLSSTTAEIQRLVVKAKQWAEQLGKPVVLWMSDKQEAFVQAIAAEFPQVPHRYCQNHFLRDVAKPMLAADSHAKVQMRRKVRGLRAIERDILAEQPAASGGVTNPPLERPATASGGVTNLPLECTAAASGGVTNPPLERPATVAAIVPSASTTVAALAPAATVVLDYCAAVRGILNDDQGGPLEPPGLRMADALGEVRASLQRNLEAKKGGARRQT